MNNFFNNIFQIFNFNSCLTLISATFPAFINSSSLLYSRQIEKIITNYCIFVRNRLETDKKEITEVTKRL